MNLEEMLSVRDSASLQMIEEPDARCFLVVSNPCDCQGYPAPHQ